MHLCKTNQHAVPDKMPVGGEQQEVYSCPHCRTELAAIRNAQLVRCF